MSKKKTCTVDIMDCFCPAVPKTRNQKLATDFYDKGNHLLLSGFPGTGKTFLALSMALRSVNTFQYKQVIIVRSAVSTRDIGFLPGNHKEKMSEYERPYVEICQKLFDSKSQIPPFRQLQNSQYIQVMSTSYIRGITLEDCVIIIDEFQNMIEHELYSLLTRVGQNCRVVLCGDILQNDLRNQKSGFFRLIETIKKMHDFKQVDFQIEDIVRSNFAREFIINWQSTEYNDFAVTPSSKAVQSLFSS